MLNNDQVEVTKEGLDALKKELEELKEVKRPQVVDRLAHARAEGDLSENSDYHNARDELEFLDGRIEEIENVVKSAKIVDGRGRGDGVAVGTSVKVKVNGNQSEFHIVGEWEADPTESKISHTSPLGQALFGKKVGEKVEVEVPAGTLTYEILDIK
ncbi:transcription elongation factor GreA [Candidatus Woesebacteria bacterium]|nr:transcription elongation factor GreA [Candidatus Woesebacteria bacterium]